MRARGNLLSPKSESDAGVSSAPDRTERIISVMYRQKNAPESDALANAFGSLKTPSKQVVVHHAAPMATKIGFSLLRRASAPSPSSHSAMEVMVKNKGYSHPPPVLV